MPSFYPDNQIVQDNIVHLLNMKPELVPPFELSDADFDMVRGCFNQINLECHLRATFSKQIIQNQIIELLHKVNRLCTVRPASPDSNLSSSKQLVRAYQRLIDEHFHSIKTIREYADLLNVSPRFLGEVIRENTDQTALRMIHYRIIREARFLLKYTPQTIREISDVLNFESLAYFTRFFKNYSGISPADFRKVKDTILSFA
ncbi:helix-turn-helix domain-containing protein [Pedobacter sp. NJ-S-72]